MGMNRNDSRRHIRALLLCSCLSGAGNTGADPSVFPVEVNATIPVPVIASDIFLRSDNDPRSPIWHRVPRYRVTLQPAPPVHQSVSLQGEVSMRTRELDISAARDDERLYILLSWRDESREATNAYARFADAAAVQFALDGGDSTSYMMGAADTPVNIWYWRAGRAGAENLAAAGFGSTEALPLQNVTAASDFDADRARWTVVLSRPLDSEGEYHARLQGGRPVPFACALWEGAAAQRDGHKLTTPGWLRLAFDQ
ncbi:MAG TPA: ethylbenzene dehydrogenase-related protein [Gammaproteobacteria bacterium]|nr:ethylbenzene dehydrogenase-related protein [Gammaproteobacteria bacterium]